MWRFYVCGCGCCITFALSTSTALSIIPAVSGSSRLSVIWLWIIAEQAPHNNNVPVRHQCRALMVKRQQEVFGFKLTKHYQKELTAEQTGIHLLHQSDAAHTWSAVTLPCESCASIFWWERRPDSNTVLVVWIHLTLTLFFSRPAS